MTGFSKPTNGDNRTHTRTFAPPPITLERPTPPELKKGTYVTVKLRSVPTEDNSQTYDLNIGIFRSGTPEAFLEFRKDVEKAVIGQNITTGPGSYAMARRLLSGDALAVFNARATTTGNETTANFKLVMDALATHVFPQRALRMQKRYMRRYMRKPKNISTREYIARVNEINGYLEDFPPFGANQKLPTDEVLDLLEFGVPSLWQKQFWLQGFDPIAHSIGEFTEFCERLEFTEDLYDESHGRNKRSKTDTDPKGSRKPDSKLKPDNANKKQKSSMWCEYHQTDTHNMSDCKVILAQARKMRAAWENRSDSSKKSYKQEQNYSAEQLNTIVTTKVKEALKSIKDTKRKRSGGKDGTEQNFNIDELKKFEILELSESENDE